MGAFRPFPEFCKVAKPFLMLQTSSNWFTVRGLFSLFKLMFS